MGVELLDKTRKINKLLHKSNNKLVFDDMCNVLSDILKSNMIIISEKGKILGVKNTDYIQVINHLIGDQVGVKVDPLLNERFLNILSTQENINLLTLGFEAENIENYRAIVTPIDIAGSHLGTMFGYKINEEYNIDDIILIEYGTTVIALEMKRAISEENEEKARKSQIVQSAINTLSSSELEAIINVFNELDGNEGILVASKIADRVGITRSIIVNALRKLESAGVIESRSSGMKGTYIKVLNDLMFDELEKIQNKKDEDQTNKE